MKALSSAVVNQVGKAPEGVPVGAKELLHLGTRATVDQTLSRLVRRGSLIRVGHVFLNLSAADRREALA